jgi:hypothetical protein
LRIDNWISLTARGRVVDDVAGWDLHFNAICRGLYTLWYPDFAHHVLNPSNQAV